MRIIPIGRAASQVFTLELEGESVIVRLRHINLLDRWEFSLERDEVEILSGQRMVTGTNMLAPYNFGLGAFLCYSPEDLGRDPRRNDFLERAQFIHVSEAELAAVST